MDRRIESAQLGEFDVVISVEKGAGFCIGGRLGLTVESGSYELVSDESATGSHVERLIEFEGTVLSSAIVGDVGALNLVGNAGSALRVPADPEYEAWKANSEVGTLVVSTPGGSLYIWDNL